MLKLLVLSGWTDGENVNSPMVAGHTQQAAVRVEVDTEDCCRLGSSPQLSQNVSRAGVKDPDESALGAGGGHFAALDVDLNDGQTGVVSRDIQRGAVSTLKVDEVNVTRLGAGHG